ncbi:MAG TPA: transaldolase [Woeseiaceae bacterium]|nr:transaldolase [Woeseiaceae bacterium]
MATRGETRRMSPVRKLVDFGQSPWLDFIQRGLLTGGELERMIADWGLRGLTSNPVIFEKAIAHTDEYDADIEALAREGSSAEEIYETLAIQDVQQAADLLLPVYEESDRSDGFASLEVSPHKANDGGATVAEARRLWAALGRRNVMIKVPATAEGLVALRTLLADGINVNVTLLFSVDRYREVLQSHLEGMEDAIAAGKDPGRIASVASFFLSRVDTLVDARLDQLAAKDDAHSKAAAALRGETAIASARQAYAVFEEFIAGSRFRKISTQGARPQRLLWASTGTKDPAYSDVRYVEALIGPLTVNTMPLETIKAYDDHGQPELRLTGHADDAAAKLRKLAELGIDLHEVTGQLLQQGIDKFVKPYDSLVGCLERARRAALAAPSIGIDQRAERGA